MTKDQIRNNLEVLPGSTKVTTTLENLKKIMDEQTHGSIVTLNKIVKHIADKTIQADIARPTGHGELASILKKVELKTRKIEGGERCNIEMNSKDRDKIIDIFKKEGFRHILETDELISITLDIVMKMINNAVDESIPREIMQEMADEMVEILLNILLVYYHKKLVRK